MENRDRTKDGHIRIEAYKQFGTNIYVDLFDSGIKDSNDAHLTSECFQWADEGAEEATRFLQKHGFRIVVMIK